MTDKFDLEESKKFATDVLTSTLHGPLPTKSAMRLAQDVVTLCEAIQPAEVLFIFANWLSVRKKEMILGNCKSHKEVLRLTHVFCEKNGFDVGEKSRTRHWKIPKEEE